MKKIQEPKKFRVKMLRGAVGENGETVTAKDTITCGRNLAKILESTGRGEILKSGTKAE